MDRRNKRENIFDNDERKRVFLTEHVSYERVTAVRLGIQGKCIFWNVEKVCLIIFFNFILRNIFSEKRFFQGIEKIQFILSLFLSLSE